MRLAQLRQCLGREDAVVARIHDHRQTGRAADCGDMIGQALLARLHQIGWQQQNPVRPGFLGCLCHFARQCGAVPASRDDRHLS